MRFAILARVSTNEQAQTGQSLEVQTKTLKDCVQMLNGQVVKEYIGQEHATADHERPILDEMLSDAKNKRFDCLMVYDLSRITRDPIRGKIIFATLKNHGIRVFAQTTEHDLNSPESMFLLGILAEANAFQVAIQVKKSIESKIELAKKGWQMFGRAPWGRSLEHNNHSRQPVWILDPDKAALAQRIYDLYINQNIYIDKIAKMLNIQPATLFKIVKDNGEHKQTVKQGSETIVIKTAIPPLFTKEQQDQLKARLRKNKRDNAKKNPYLLSGFVKCRTCGYTFLGFTTNQGKNAYYRHSIHNNTPDCLKHINKTKLDKTVLDQISELVSNNDRLMSTIRECNQFSINKKDVLTKRIKELKTRKDKLEKTKARIVDLIIDETLTNEDAEARMKKTKTEIEEVSREILINQTELEGLVTVEVPDEVIERIKYTFDCLKGRFGQSISHWDFSIQRLLVEWFFGTDVNYGVWVKNFDGDVAYTIKSSLGAVVFGWMGDEGAAGITGQEAMKSNVETTLTQFISIIQNLEEPYTRKAVDEHHGWHESLDPPTCQAGQRPGDQS